MPQPETPPAPPRKPFRPFALVRSALACLLGFTPSELAALRRAAREVAEQAYRDALTGLGSRRLLLERLQQALATGGGTHGALLFVDLDHFRTLNDAAGHEVGDLLLQRVAERLGTCVREGDTVARLGGDEFVLLLAAPQGPEQALQRAEHVGERVLAALGATYELEGHTHFGTASVGAAPFAPGGGSTSELLRRADLARVQAKAAGRNALRFYDPAMQGAVAARTELEGALRQALARREFVLHYQPQVAADGRLIGAEALVRWQHPQRGLLYPGDFVALAEDSGLVVPLGLQVLELAGRQLAAWSRQHGLEDFSLSVNVSARQFRQRDFAEQVLATLERTGADPARFKLELTESLLVDSVEDTIAKMRTLKAHGVGFSLDDFGTGYSSLAYLKRLPLDQLKIDQSFVHGVLADANDAAIAQTIVALGRNLGLQVIAEGVETEEQRIFLAGCGCHAYQGYLFGRPVCAEDFEAVTISRAASFASRSLTNWRT